MQKNQYISRLLPAPMVPTLPVNLKDNSKDHLKKPIDRTEFAPNRASIASGDPDTRDHSVHPHRGLGSEVGNGRIAIFIDGSNLFYAALQLGIEIDYAKLLSYLTGGRSLLRAYFYTGVDPQNDKQQRFLLWMRRNGYRVITKDLIQLPDGSKKANLDVEIAMDMLILSPHCESIVLLSGDGDLAYALNTIAYRGVNRLIQKLN
jgi:NYN domain